MDDQIKAAARKRAIESFITATDGSVSMIEYAEGYADRNWQRFIDDTDEAQDPRR